MPYELARFQRDAWKFLTVLLREMGYMNEEQIMPRIDYCGVAGRRLNY